MHVRSMEFIKIPVDYVSVLLNLSMKQQADTLYSESWKIFWIADRSCLCIGSQLNQSGSISRSESESESE